jgi:hypothetical protein
MGTDLSEAPGPQGGASRKGNFILIVLLDPAYKAGLAGHLPVKSENKWFSATSRVCSNC